MLKVNVPEGESGTWMIKRFSVSKVESMMSSFRLGGRAPLPGEYTKLTQNGYIVMSDTNAEMRDHNKAVDMANGHILINGLGLGMVLLNCMEKPEVKMSTVIEISQDVINLSAPFYKQKYGDKVNIIKSDAMEYKPPKGIRYGMVWHDIWPDICADNYEEMKKLHRKYGRFSDWQGSWCREECKRLIKKDTRGW